VAFRTRRRAERHGVRSYSAVARDAVDRGCISRHSYAITVAVPARHFRPPEMRMARRPIGLRPNHPYVPDEQHLPEFTWSAVVVGSLLASCSAPRRSIWFLKVGLTVSASILSRVVDHAVRVFSKVLRFVKRRFWKTTIVQTAGSAGESIAFGVGVTMRR